MHGAHRDSCPCQNFGDSGLALDSRCEAVAPWHKPQRFRKVCPLLVETRDGWRCSVDAERVRPFWGRAFACGGGLLLALYLAGTVAVYATLRKAGYPLSYVTVAWPGNWPDLRQAREQLHVTRAQQALAAGDYPAAILSLQTVCQLNPLNYDAAITLAGLLQLSGQPAQAESIYQRLMQDVPEQRAATAQIWFHLLLARADYPAIKPLAAAMLSEDSGHREAWLHALVFAARQTNDGPAMGALLTGELGLPDWCSEVATLEQLLLQQRVEQALPRLNRRFPGTAAYLPCYQVDRLLRLDRPDQASRLLDDYGRRLPAEEASFLRVRILEARGWSSLIETEYDTLLHLPLTPHLAALFCAFLLERPADKLLPLYLDRFLQAAPPLTRETLPLYHAVFLVAELGGQPERARQLSDLIARFPPTNAQPLHELADILKRKASPAPMLPLVPLPLEAVYAIQESAAKKTAAP